VKDRTFVGRDLKEALALAEKTLGLPTERLRYVVLSHGSPGALGMAGTPAEIAVLLGDREPSAPAPEAPAPVGEGGEGDPRDLVVKVLGALVQAAALDIGVEVEEDADTLKVKIAGKDQNFFLEHDAEVLESLEYLLRRALPGEDFPRLVLECEGRRELREEGLRKTARDLVAAVLADGVTRSTPPLNAYERRIIHMTVAETRGLTTKSIGEGADRRVTIAPVFPEDAE
jgi:spoIIIJ-associated protein